MRKKSEVGPRSNRTFRLSEYEMKCLKEGARNAEMGESEFAAVSVPALEDVENLLMIDIPKLPKPVKELEKNYVRKGQT